MALILSIETSTPVCSVALARDGQLLAMRESHEAMSHAASLAAFIQEIFDEQQIVAAQLDAVAVSEGPGSYTGLRIGVSTAKGIAFGIQKPLIAIPTLKAMANGHRQRFGCLAGQLLAPMIDARRMEVYTAVYDCVLNEHQSIEAKLIDSESFSQLLEQHKISFFGDGAGKCQSTIQSANASFNALYTISATDMISLAEECFNQQKFVDIAYFEPFYLKEFIAVKPKNKILGE